jgi:hypothetical protein
MAKITNNVRSYGDLLQMVATAPIGTALPSKTAIWTPGTPPAGFYDLGWLTDTGLSENETYNETKKYGWQGGTLLRVLRNQAELVYQFEAAEENAVTVGLLRPNSPTTTSGETDEVQTVTISGTPTGGTFPLTLPGYGSYSAAYNVSTAALQTALRAAFGIPGLTVTGTAGTSYVVTFVGAGNVPTMLTDGSALTGGSSPNAAVAVTTPGVNGVNSRDLKPYTGRNLRYWVVDLVDGSVWKRKVLTNAEAVRNGAQTYKADDDVIYPFTLNCYLDSNSVWGYEMDNNPAVASGLFT